MVRITNLHELVVVVEVSHKYTSIGAREVLPGFASVLKCLICDFEQLSLRRVHCHSFYRGNAKEIMIELLRIFFQEVAAFGKHATRAVLVRVVEAAEIKFVVFEFAVAGSLLF